MADLLDSQKSVNSVCMSLLLQEIVPTSIRVSQKLSETHADTSPLQTRIDTPLSSIARDLPGTIAVFDSENIGSDEVTLRIESYGYSLGLRLTEVLMYKAAANTSKIVDILDIMKFVCRDVWKCLYGKQMDNLRTNHRGTFVLIDNSYRVISGLNSAKGNPDSVNKARSYLWFPCGIIRGILMSFGIEAYITAEISQFPAVSFNIQTAINN